MAIHLMDFSRGATGQQQGSDHEETQGAGLGNEDQLQTVGHTAAHCGGVSNGQGLTSSKINWLNGMRDSQIIDKWIVIPETANERKRTAITVDSDVCPRSRATWITGIHNYVVKTSL